MSSNTTKSGLAIAYVAGNRVVFKYLLNGLSDKISDSYNVDFRGNNLPDSSKLTGMGSLTWDVNKFHLLLTTDTYTRRYNSQVPCKAFDMILDTGLNIMSVARLPISINTADYDMKLNDQEGQGASIFMINEYAFATVSPFFRYDEDGRIIQNTGLPMDDAAHAGLCRQKPTNDARDYSLPNKAGSKFPADYQPSPDWFFAPCNLPDPNNKPPNFFTDSQIGKFMPSRVTTRPGSEKVYALWPSSDPSKLLLGHMSPQSLSSLTASANDPHWAFLSIETNLTTYAACPLLVQGSDLNTKPRLYIFCVNALDGTPGKGYVWLFELPLKTGGSLDIAPGTSVVKNIVTSKAPLFVTDPRYTNIMVEASWKKPLLAVACDNELALCISRDDQVYMMYTTIQADGSIFTEKPQPPRPISTDGGCQLLGATAFTQ